MLVATCMLLPGDASTEEKQMCQLLKKKYSWTSYDQLLSDLQQQFPLSTCSPSIYFKSINFLLYCLKNCKKIFEGWNEGEGSGVIGHDCSSRLLPNHYYNAAPPRLLHCTAQPCQSRAGVKQWTGVSQLSSSSFAAQSSSPLILLFLLPSPIRFWVWSCRLHIFYWYFSTAQFSDLPPQLLQINVLLLW